MIIQNENCLTILIVANPHALLIKIIFIMKNRFTITTKIMLIQKMFINQQIILIIKILTTIMITHRIGVLNQEVIIIVMITMINIPTIMGIITMDIKIITVVIITDEKCFHYRNQKIYRDFKRLFFFQCKNLILSKKHL